MVGFLIVVVGCFGAVWLFNWFCQNVNETFPADAEKNSKQNNKQNTP